MKTKLPKAQGGGISKAVKAAKVAVKKPTTKPKVTMPKVDPRSGKPLTIDQINAIKSGKKLDFHTVDEQHAKKQLKKAVEARTNPKPAAKKSTYKSREEEYERALWESYQQKGGVVKKKYQNGGTITKKSTNPITGRTKVTETREEKTSGTVAPRPIKTTNVYSKKGNNVKTVDVYKVGNRKKRVVTKN
jgi:hypothetical protein